MPHKLQIKLIFEQALSEDFKRWLSNYLNPLDIVRGIDCTLKLVAKNIGEKDFPGGHVKSAIVRYSGGVQQEIPPVEIPEIKINEEKPFLEETFIPLSEGSGGIEIEIDVKDGETVECYQRRLDRPIGINRCIDVFYTVNRESLNIMWRLDKLLGWK